MSLLDVDGLREGLLGRVGDRRQQVIRFVRQMDELKLHPGHLPEGVVQALAEADAALARVEAALAEEEITLHEMDVIERRLGEVEDHILEVEQELWSAAVRTRGR